MGIFNRSVSFSRFKTTKHLDFSREELLAKIKQNTFREIEEQSDDELSIGWVNLTDWMDNKFENASFSKGEFITLSLRVDKRKVPKQAILSGYRKRLTERYSEEEERITKEEKNDIKQAITAHLLRRAIPTTQTYDMIWNTKTNEVLFTSTSEKLCLSFFEVFNKTFGCTLTQFFPYSMAEKQGNNLSLKQLNATNFVHGTFSNTEHSDNRTELPDMKRFLGQEFLIWLWCMSDTTKNRLSIEEPEQLEAYIGDKITLETLTGEDNEKVICHGQTSEMSEAIKAINKGKKITSIEFNITVEDRDYTFTLDDKWFNFKACKTPKVTLDKEDMDGAFFEKIYFINDLMSIFKHLFDNFIQERLNASWQTKVNAIISWLHTKVED